MTSALADTQTIIQYFLDRTKLSAPALQMVSDAEREHRLFVSAITRVEVRMEVEAGRVPQEAWDKLWAAVTDRHRPLTVLPVDQLIVEAFAQTTGTDNSSLSSRIVAATAASHELRVVAATGAGLGSVSTLDEAVSVAERDAILAALKQCDQHRERAANVLGISVRTLHYKLSRLGL